MIEVLRELNDVLDTAIEKLLDDPETSEPILQMIEEANCFNVFEKPSLLKRIALSLMK